eukprot:CAMPEP_0171204360 /NCGR_PEP_ID=MMETSP0790-20130122/26002_1 /TAXON_ID=2925 /ORGANISM="Alexandrium catenella, Strain OF101" /LENGTH=125 /DNA_ID=CAMNT_0011669861 /DNA_START=198 /DNA_END=576 /DNA_ORIENTATION=+
MPGLALATFAKRVPLALSSVPRASWMWPKRWRRGASWPSLAKALRSRFEPVLSAGTPEADVADSQASRLRQGRPMAALRHQDVHAGRERSVVALRAAEGHAVNAQAEALYAATEQVPAQAKQRLL